VVALTGGLAGIAVALATDLVTPLTGATVALGLFVLGLVVAVLRLHVYQPRLTRTPIAPMSPPSPARQPLPRFVTPMLLHSGPPALPGAGEWAIEVKFDGIRAQLRVDGAQGWCLRSRPGRDCTAQFPELAGLADALAAHRVTLDGELVHLGADGRPDFAPLRRRLAARDAAAASGTL
jgi:ATP-dependent DNA ligase